MDNFAKEFERSLKKEAGNIIFERGEHYKQAKRVITWSTYDEAKGRLGIRGTIRGSRTYHAELSIDKKSGALVGWECHCPYEDLCKHVVALGLVYLTHLEKHPPRIIALGPKTDTSSAIPILPTEKKEQEDDPIVSLRAELASLGIAASELDESILSELLRRKMKSSLSVTSSTPVAHTHTPALRAQKPISETHVLLVHTNWKNEIRDVSLEKKDGRTWYAYEDAWRRHTLSVHPQTKEEEECIALLGAHFKSAASDIYRDKEIATDFFLLLDATVRAHIPIVLAESAYGETSQTPCVVRKPERFAVRFVTEEHTSLYGAYPYRTIALALPRTKHKKVAAVASASGLVYLHNGYVEFHALPELLARVIARAILNKNEDEYHYGYNTSCTETKKNFQFATLLESEYADLAELLDAARTHAELIEPFEPPLLQKHTARPVIIVDYKKDERVVEVMPAIDYGGDVLALTDLMHVSTSVSYKKTVTRRSDAAFGKTHVVRVTEDAIHLAPVNEKMEQKFFRRCQKQRDALGLSAKIKANIRGERRVMEFAEIYLPRLKALGYEMRFPHGEPKYERAEFRAEFDIDASGENDWLAFDVALYCGDERVTLADIEAFLESGGTTLMTKDGRALTIKNPETIRTLIDMLAHFRKGDGDRYEGKAYHAPGLEAMSKSSPHYTARLSDSFKSFMSEARSGRAVAHTPIPPLFGKVLRPYQKAGVYWLSFLRHYRFGGILADDMGLGKTLQALAIISMHAKEGTSLVVAPKTLLYNWEREARTFAPHLKVAVIDGSPILREEKLSRAHTYDLVITSYPALLKDIARYEAFEKPFHYCVLDEAQYVKNPRTKQSHTVRRIKSEYRLALTGTPLENSVEELWSMFEFLMPGFLGHHAHFQKHFRVPITKRGDENALAHLRAKVECFMLRRNKEEVLKELPAKTEQAILCELSDEQNILYQDVLLRVRSEIETGVKKRGFAASQIHILAGLTRLRQICNHPALAMGVRGEEAKRYPSAKLDACLEIVASLRAERRKVLIFSQFTEMLDIIADALKEQGTFYSYLSGKTRKRADVVDAFMHNPDITAFLISTKAGGVGLNLTAADAVIIFDPWWNPQVERQAIDRTHRIGQTKSVHVFRLRTKGTIEEKIVALGERKQKLFNAMVGENAGLFKKLTWEDVRSLFA